MRWWRATPWGGRARGLCAHVPQVIGVLLARSAAVTRCRPVVGVERDGLLPLGVPQPVQHSADHGRVAGRKQAGDARSTVDRRADPEEALLHGLLRLILHDGHRERRGPLGRLRPHLVRASRHGELHQLGLRALELAGVSGRGGLLQFAGDRRSGLSPDRPAQSRSLHRRQLGQLPHLRDELRGLLPGGLGDAGECRRGSLEAQSARKRFRRVRIRAPPDLPGDRELDGIQLPAARRKILREPDQLRIRQRRWVSGQHRAQAGERLARCRTDHRHAPTLARRRPN